MKVSSCTHIVTYIHAQMRENGGTWDALIKAVVLSESKNFHIFPADILSFCSHEGVQVSVMSWRVSSLDVTEVSRIL